MRNMVIGTAGHIDHGKSALVEALTGTHPDRLEEEKRRGITLDIGFAFLQLGELNIGFVDVPGHERFVRNMLAGASGFDLVLLVIAADESIKPQTREHFEICKLLGIPQGLVVLTKCDLVDADVLELVRLETEEFVRGSFLEGAPTIAVSAKTGAGLGELRQELARIAAGTPRKDAFRYFRLPIDRAFSIKGFGTVVTGTLIAGEVQPGDEVELFPARRLLRVRGVHSGGKSVSSASAGQRTALNLAGIEHHQIRRGMVLAAPKRFETATRLDARIHLLGSAVKLKDRTRVHFHHGAFETIVEVRLFGLKEIMPGCTALAQLRLAEPTLALPGDRFVLRQFSPVVTIGGGTVLNIPMGRQLANTQFTSFLETQERGLNADVFGRAAALEAIVNTSSGSTVADLVLRTGWAEEELNALVRDLAGNGRLRLVNAEPLLAVSPHVVNSCIDRLLSELDRFHRMNPLAEAISKEDLRTRCASALRSDIFRAALDDAVSSGKVALAGDLVKRGGHSIQLQPLDAKAKDQIEREFARGGLTPPSLDSVLASLSVEKRKARQLFELLVREGILLKLADDMVVHREAIDRARAMLIEYKKANGNRLGVAEFKALAGISRKFAIPLLEYLDRGGITRRVGDYRVIL